MADAAAIVFDLDDTLYPERDYAFSGYRAVAAAFDGKLGRRDDLLARMRELFDTPDRGRVFDVILADAGAADSEATITEMIEVYRRHAPRISLLSDAESAIVRLRADHKLGLITDGYAGVQHAKIDALRLRDRFDDVIVTDDWGREYWKPHPRAFETMAERLGVAASRCTYVADNPSKDFDAPNALGWRTVFIKRPGAVYVDAALSPAGTPARTITTLDDL